MSLYNYFTKLGAVSYGGEIATNLITSVRFVNKVKSRVEVFHPYTIKDGERADTIADFYYGDSRYAWLIYLSNSIVDPYYEWPLSGDQFKSYINKKYTSLEKAATNIAFFKNNWASDDRIISSANYQSLPITLKKYWNPIVGYNNTVVTYERKRSDDVVETNKIVSLSLTPNTNNLLIGEIVRQTSTNSYGTVRAILSDSIVINHVIGEFTTGSLVGAESGASKTITSTTTVSTPIGVLDIPYWTPVTYLDYENDVNESRKEISLIDNQYVSFIEDEMISMLK